MTDLLAEVRRLRAENNRLSNSLGVANHEALELGGQLAEARALIQTAVDMLDEVEAGGHGFPGAVEEDAHKVRNALDAFLARKP